MQFDWTVFSNIILQFAFQVTFTKENSATNEIRQYKSILDTSIQVTINPELWVLKDCEISLLTYATLFYIVIKGMKYICWTKFIYLIPWEITPYWIQVYITF